MGKGKFPLQLHHRVECQKRIYMPNRGGVKMQTRTGKNETRPQRLSRLNELAAAGGMHRLIALSPREQPKIDPLAAKTLPPLREGIQGRETELGFKGSDGKTMYTSAEQRKRFNEAEARVGEAEQKLEEDLKAPPDPTPVPTPSSTTTSIPVPSSTTTSIPVPSSTTTSTTISIPFSERAVVPGRYTNNLVDAVETILEQAKILGFQSLMASADVGAYAEKLGFKNEPTFHTADELKQKGFKLPPQEAIASLLRDFDEAPPGTLPPSLTKNKLNYPTVMVSEIMKGTLIAMQDYDFSPEAHKAFDLIFAGMDSIRRTGHPSRKVAEAIAKEMKNANIPIHEMLLVGRFMKDKFGYDPGANNEFDNMMIGDDDDQKTIPVPEGYEDEVAMEKEDDEDYGQNDDEDLALDHNEKHQQEYYKTHNRSEDKQVGRFIRYERGPKGNRRNSVKAFFVREDGTEHGQLIKFKPTVDKINKLLDEDQGTWAGPELPEDWKGTAEPTYHTEASKHERFVAYQPIPLKKGGGYNRVYQKVNRPGHKAGGDYVYEKITDPKEIERVAKIIHAERYKYSKNQRRAMGL